MFVFFFNDTATTEIYTLSLPDALPIWGEVEVHLVAGLDEVVDRRDPLGDAAGADVEHPGVVLGHDREADAGARSEEHTSELQSRQYLVCRLLLEKKKIHVMRLSTTKHR